MSSQPTAASTSLAVNADILPLLFTDLKLTKDPRTRSSSESNRVSRFLESDLHRHYFHLSKNAPTLLRTAMLGFISSLHLTEAYMELLKPDISFLLPDRDQLTWIVVRKNTKNVLDVRPFILQTNPNVNVRARITQRAMRRLKTLMDKAQVGHLFDQLTNTPLGVVEIHRPTTKRYKFWNKNGKSVECFSSSRSPFKVRAYLSRMRVTGVDFSGTKFVTMRNAGNHQATSDLRHIETGQRVLTQEDFRPGGFNLIYCVEKMFWFVKSNQAKLGLLESPAILTAILQGLVMGVKTKYGVTLGTRVSVVKPDMVHNLVFLVTDDR